MKKEKDVLIDVSNLAYRCSHAYAELSHAGIPTGHIYGTIQVLLAIHKKVSQNSELNFIYCLDGVPVWRKAQFPDYKANRVKSLGFDPRQDVIALLSLLPGKILINPEEEADDVIAAYIKRTYSLDKDYVIISSDKDLWVLKDRYQATILGNAQAEVTSSDIKEAFFTDKAEFISLVKGVIGDSGDNLPKVMRFPRKDLTTILASMKIPTVRELVDCAEQLAREKKISARAFELLFEEEKQIKHTFSLASLREDIQYTETINQPNKEALTNILVSANCVSLLNRVNVFFT